MMGGPPSPRICFCGEVCPERCRRGGGTFIQISANILIQPAIPLTCYHCEAVANLLQLFKKNSLFQFAKTHSQCTTLRSFALSLAHSITLATLHASFTFTGNSPLPKIAS